MHVSADTTHLTDTVNVFLLLSRWRGVRVQNHAVRSKFKKENLKQVVQKQFRYATNCYAWKKKL